MNRYEETLVAEHSAAVLYRTSQLVGEAGKSFESARRQAMRELKLRHLPQHLRNQAELLISTFEPCDVTKADQRKAHARMYERGTARSDFHDTWYNRLLWRWFSMTW